MNKLGGLKARFGIMGYGLSTPDNELKEKLTKLEEVRTSLKDIYKKLERKCISECAIGEIGTVSADAFTNFSKDAKQKSIVDPAYSEISLLAEKAGDMQGMLSIIENAHYETLKQKVAYSIKDFVKGPLREARYAHVEYQHHKTKLDSISKQIAAENKKPNSQKLSKLKEEEYQLKKESEQKRDEVIQLMDNILAQSKTFEAQILKTFLEINIEHYAKVMKNLTEISTELESNELGCSISSLSLQQSVPSQQQQFQQPQNAQQVYQQQQPQQPQQQQQHFQQTYHQSTTTTQHAKPRGSFLGGARGTAYQQTRQQQQTDAKVDTEFDEALKLIDGI